MKNHYLRWVWVLKMDAIMIALGVLALFLIGGYFMVKEASSAVKTGIQASQSAASNIIRDVSNAPATTVRQLSDALKQSMNSTSSAAQYQVKSWVDLTQSELSETGQVIADAEKHIISVPVDTMTTGLKTVQNNLNATWSTATAAGYQLAVMPSTFISEATKAELQIGESAMHWMNTNANNVSAQISAAEQAITGTKTYDLFGFKIVNPLGG
jgi:hypothetical protein